MSYTAIGGASYFVTFKDDFSGFVSIFFIKKKSEVFAYYRLFAALVKNHTGKDVLTFRSDGGGEHESNEFQDHLKEKGVRHETSCAYTPSQNGVSERTNRTVMEAARCMLHSSNAPLWLWGEAVMYAAYILNRVPSREKLKTPFELFYKTKPNVSNIKVFGSRTFVLIPDKDRTKIDGKSKEGILVGFDENQKGYRVYIPSERKVIVSCHVQIDETTMYSNQIDNPVASSEIDSTSDPFQVLVNDQVTFAHFTPHSHHSHVYFCTQ